MCNSIYGVDIKVSLHLTTPGGCNQCFEKGISYLSKVRFLVPQCPGIGMDDIQSMY